MAILLICRKRSGKAAFPEKTIGALHAPAREYKIVKGHVLLSGYHDAVLHHDAADLLHTPGRLYRLPTPDEQMRFFEQERERGMIQEGQQHA